MTPLQRQLATAASVYADLVDAALPGNAGDPNDRPAPDPTRKPAPGNLGVMEHRHELVRGLRWWVDAVRDPGEHTQVGHDVTLMARWLAEHVDVMDETDARDLEAHLRRWLGKAAGIMGSPDSPPISLPVEAMDRVVSQRVAAEALGVPVSTVWRRAGRQGGDVRLSDVAGPLCERCDLPAAWCEHREVSA